MNKDIIRLRISAQNALLGRITKEVRAIYLSLDKACINLYVIIDGKISKYWKDTICEIGTDIIADFNYPYIINERTKRIDYPNKLSLLSNEIYVYKRYEDE